MEITTFKYRKGTFKFDDTATIEIAGATLKLNDFMFRDGGGIYPTTHKILSIGNFTDESGSVPCIDADWAISGKEWFTQKEANDAGFYKSKQEAQNAIASRIEFDATAKTKITFKIPVETIRRFDLMAQMKGKSRTTTIEELINNFANGNIEL